MTICKKNPTVFSVVWSTLYTGGELPYYKCSNILKTYREETTQEKIYTALFKYLSRSPIKNNIYFKIIPKREKIVYSFWYKLLTNENQLNILLNLHEDNSYNYELTDYLISISRIHVLDELYEYIACKKIYIKQNNETMTFIKKVITSKNRRNHILRWRAISKKKLIQ